MSNKDRYDKVLDELRKANVPCKVQLTAEDEIHISLGFNYPDELRDKADEAAQKAGIKNVEINADSGGYKIKRWSNIKGGPKSYSKFF